MKMKWNIGPFFDKHIMVCLLTLTLPFLLPAQQVDSLQIEDEDEILYIYDPNWEEELAEKAPFQIRQDSNGTKGVLDYRTREWVIPPIYDEVGWVPSYPSGIIDAWKNASSLIRVKKDERWGLFTKEGQEIFPLEFKSMMNLSPASENYTIWRLQNQEGRYGLLKTNGDTLLAFQYERIYFVQNQFYNAEQKGKRMQINLEGEMTESPHWFSPPLYTLKNGESIYRATHQGLMGVLRENGEELLPFEYSSVSVLLLDYFKVVHPSKGAGIYDIDFKEVIPCQYEDVQALNMWQINGFYLKSEKPYILMRQKGNALYAFIDLEGNQLSPPSFHQPDKMLVFNDVIFDQIGKNQYNAKSMAGELLMQDTFSSIYTIGSPGSAQIKLLLQKGNTYLSVCKDKHKCALLDLQEMKTVTPFEYTSFQTPIIATDGAPIKLVTGKKNNLNYLLRLDGSLLSEIGFSRVTLSDNYYTPPSVLLDHPNAEAIMETAEGKKYVLIENKVQAVLD